MHIRMGASFLVGALCAAGAFLVWMQYHPFTIYSKPLRLVGEYKLVAPLLACQTLDSGVVPSDKALTKKIQTIITSAEANHNAEDVSVYIQHFNTGQWVGIGENKLYAPASLAKVPLFIAYLKAAQDDPSILNKSVLYSGSLESEDEEDFQPMTVGKTYTIQDLLYRLIIYSDNDAKDYLHNIINPTVVTDVFKDFGLEEPSAQDTGDSMSPKEYSIFFRTLYNSTYLTPDISEAALQILSETKFNDGLVAGVASSTPVAHKFGHRRFDMPQLGQGGITEELHDCGIVYTQPNPYFICVMTKGWNVGDLKSTIARISQAAYQTISAEKN